MSQPCPGPWPCGARLALSPPAGWRPLGGGETRRHTQRAVLYFEIITSCPLGELTLAVWRLWPGLDHCPGMYAQAQSASDGWLPSWCHGGSLRISLGALQVASTSTGTACQWGEQSTIELVQNNLHILASWVARAASAAASARERVAPQAVGCARVALPLSGTGMQQDRARTINK